MTKAPANSGTPSLAEAQEIMTRLLPGLPQVTRTRFLSELAEAFSDEYMRRGYDAPQWVPEILSAENDAMSTSTATAEAYHQLQSDPEAMTLVAGEFIKGMPPGMREAALWELLRVLARIYKERGAELPEWLAKALSLPLPRALLDGGNSQDEEAPTITKLGSDRWVQ
jgi:hypothetical protein